MRIAKLCLSAMAIALVVHAVLGVAENRADAAPPQDKITIGKESTYITKPLRSDGYPDYVAALNEIYSRGVTPENNAAVLLQQAFGPGEIKENLRPKFYELLGIKPLPEKGNYIVNDGEMVKRWRAGREATGNEVKDEEVEALQDAFDRAEERPWDAKEFPIVAEWLAVNEKPLALIVAASRRPNCYFPFVVGDAEPPLLGGLLLPHVQYFREAAQLLVVKAMLQTKQGNIEEAWENLKACHRLARLAVKGSTMVDALVGFAVDGVAVSGDVAFSHYAHLTTRQAEQMKAELSAFPPVGDIVDKLDTGERFLCLDATASIARKGMSKLNEIGTGSKTQKSTAWLDDFVDHIVDWNIPFKMVNRWYDRLVAAGRITDQQRRRDACAAINKDLIELSTDLKSLRNLIFEFFTKKTPEELVGSRMGASIVLLFLPAFDAGLNAQDRVDLCSQMDLTAFALATFRADHGEYPTKLDLLVPKYIDKIPIDTFSRNSLPIRYRRDGDAYLMWTVHIDGVDDDGRGVEDDPPGDDHVLRPVPKLQTK